MTLRVIIVGAWMVSLSVPVQAQPMHLGSLRASSTNPNVTVGAAPALQTFPLYLWSLSASATNPNVTVGTAPGPQDFPLFLWMNCTYGDGFSTAEMRIENLATNFVMLSFTPSPGFLVVSGTFPDLTIAVGGCPQGSFVVGRINAFASGPASGEVCIEPSSSGNRVTYDCTSPAVVHPMKARGFGFGAAASCDEQPPTAHCISDKPGACCLPDGACVASFLPWCEAQGGTFQGEGSECDAVDCDPIPTDVPVPSRTWGRTKSDYR